MKNRFRKESIARTAGAIVFVVVVAAVGVHLLVSSRAATPYATIEAESGSVKTPAQSINNSAASGGSYVQFGSAPSTGDVIPTCTAYCGGTDYGPGTASTITVKDTLGDSHTVWVYRPPVPESATLPILYFLHGTLDPGEIGWQDVATYLTADMNTWLAKGGMPFVLVGPDGASDDPSVHSQSLWVNAADGTDPIETYVTTQTVAAVEGSNRRASAYRAISGFSMGGYGAANLALRNPGLYGQSAPLAGYFNTNDLGTGVFNGSSTAAAANTPLDNMGTAAQMRWFVADASDDTNSNVNTQSPPFIAALKAKGAFVQSDLSLTGGHSWAYIQEEFPVALKTLVVGWGGTSGKN